MLDDYALIDRASSLFVFQLLTNSISPGDKIVPPELEILPYCFEYLYKFCPF